MTIAIICPFVDSYTFGAFPKSIYMYIDLNTMVLYFGKVVGNIWYKYAAIIRNTYHFGQ